MGVNSRMNDLQKLAQQVREEQAKGNVINVRRLANHAGRVWSESIHE